MKTRYFVTGGTGFIGKRLIEALLKKGGIIHLLARESSDVTGIDANPSVKIFKGSLLDQKFIKEAMKGCDVVFHLAGYAKNWAKDKNIYKKINVTGSANVAKAAMESGVKKMVHVSSIVTLGPTDVYERDESYKPKKTIRFTEYERTKAEAEDEVLKFQRRGLDLTIVHPTRVYGPGLITESNSMTLMVKNYLKWHFYILLGSGKSTANYVFVEDVVKGLILAAERGKTGERYILGGENSSFKGCFQTIKKITGKRALPVIVPVPIAMAVGFICEKLAEVFSIYPLITTPWVRHFNADWLYTSSKAIKELNYSPLSLEEGLGLTIEWLQKTK